MKNRDDDFSEPREIDICDKDDPDIYAVTFYHFKYRDPGSESQTLVFKCHLTFMIQTLMFFYLIKAQGFFVPRSSEDNMFKKI